MKANAFLVGQLAIVVLTAGLAMLTVGHAWGREAAGSGASKVEQDDLRAFLSRHKIPVRDDIVAALREAQRRVASVRKGHVVIGQVELPPNCAPQDLASHVSLLPAGYFVDAVQTPGIPIWFWHPRCAFAEATPQSNGPEVEWLGRVELAADRGRATVRGIARVQRFATPEQLQLKAVYSLGFVNSIAFEVKKLKALEERLTALAEPVVEVDKLTGEFEVSGLLNAPISLQISGQGPERFSSVINPTMDMPVDLGVCELYAEPQAGPSANLQGLSAADDGRPKLELLLKQLEAQAGNSQAASSHVDRLRMKLLDVTEDCQKWVDEHGRRSAVALIMTVAVPNADLRQLHSDLTVTQAVYTPRDAPGAPRILYALVKPGSTVQVDLPGHQPFVYQVRGSRDGIEVVEAQFNPLARRQVGSARGQVTRATNFANGGLTFQLLSAAWPHLSPGGVRPGNTRQNQQEFALSAGATNGQLDFPQLQPGAYLLRVAGAVNEWPREIPFVVTPRKRSTIPRATIYEMPPAQIESLHFANAVRSPRPQSLKEADVQTVTLDFASWNQAAGQQGSKSRLEVDSWGRGRLQGMAGGFGGIRWLATPLGGNSLAFQPLLSPGWSPFDEPQSWTILRLGTDEISRYQSIEAKLGTLTRPAEPEVQRTQNAPFQLARGYTYLIHHLRAAYVILVRVQ